MDLGGVLRTAGIFVCVRARGARAGKAPDQFVFFPLYARGLERRTATGLCVEEAPMGRCHLKLGDTGVAVEKHSNAPRTALVGAQASKQHKAPLQPLGGST